MRRYATHVIVTALCAFLLGAGVPAYGAAEELDDIDITLAVEAKLIASEAVPSHKIDVSTDNGIVTLSGSVDTFHAMLAARDAAESVKGVLAVINNIDVEPVSRRDFRIRAAVVRALARDPVVESYEIDVSVDNGIVTLSGEVDSYAEKLLAEDVAEDVAGVVDIDNRIVYDPLGDRTDAEIRTDIANRLRADASIDASLITVSVDDGNVTLAGSAGSAAEKREAQREAWMVLGVQSVDNEIDVQWWLDDDASEWEGGWTDADIKQAIDTALLTNPRVKAFDVVASVDGGVATLTGVVDNLQAKRAAEEEAWDILGIRRVRNHLRVRDVPGRTDAEIADDIRDALRRDLYVDRYDVVVNVYSGKAYLTGEVDSWYMRNRAEEVAARVPGLVDIQNNLDVDYQATAKTDQEIKEDIESQLWWSPFVDSDDVSVEVRSGVATLTGTVEDYDELQAAKENAREGGAISVISKLQIEYDAEGS